MQAPTVDPLTGKPVQPPATPPPDPPDPNAPQMVTIDKAEFDGLKQRLDAFEKGVQFGQHTVQQPAAPAPPAGPTLAEQIADIDKEIVTLNGKIDEAVGGGKPVSSLMTERDNLTAKRLRLQIKHEDIDPAFNVGIQTIDQLSEEVTKGKMPYLSIPEVKTEYDKTLKGLTPDQKMNPQMRMAAYQMAVGNPANTQLILDVEKEKMLREDANPGGGAPPAGNSRNGGDGGGQDTIPEPTEFLSSGALAAIAMKNISVDEHFKRMGHPEGYVGWYKKHYMKKEEE